MTAIEAPAADPALTAELPIVVADVKLADVTPGSVRGGLRIVATLATLVALGCAMYAAAGLLLRLAGGMCMMIAGGPRC
ncbi:MAG: hypothetical protein K8T25_11720 [Planctomycetia bacterium]|nr:hypothetical protein [Planctomycetia bacterium]